MCALVFPHKNCCPILYESSTSKVIVFFKLTDATWPYFAFHHPIHINRHNFVCAPSQWETTLQYNVVPQWLGLHTLWLTAKILVTSFRVFFVIYVCFQSYVQYEYNNSVIKYDSMIPFDWAMSFVQFGGLPTVVDFLENLLGRDKLIFF